MNETKVCHIVATINQFPDKCPINFFNFGKFRKHFFIISSIADHWLSREMRHTGICFVYFCLSNYFLRPACNSLTNKFRLINGDERKCNLFVPFEVLPP